MIDNDLRRYLVHYGQRVQAVVDSFNDMKSSFSDHNLSEPHGFALSLFPPDELFTRTCLEIGKPFKYQVTDFLYARSAFDLGDSVHAEQSAYMGYVAVATEEGKRILGRRDILICWRGTILGSEWTQDKHIFQVPADEIFDNSKARVHRGFFHVYTDKTPDIAIDHNKEYTRNSAREQVLAAVRKHVDNYANTLNETVSITVAGHSLGAVLATLSSMDIVSNGYNKPTGSNTVIPVTAFVSGCPRIGNEDFVALFNSLSGLHLLNIQNAKDHVPTLLPNCFWYYDVGTMLDIDVTKIEDLKHDKLETQPHNPNVYLYAIASYQGKDNVPQLAPIDFDMAILNKDVDLLENKFRVPKSWFQSVMRHGMVQMDNTGKWEVRYYYVPPVPAPVPHIPPN